jgi:hypothetical protein
MDVVDMTFDLPDKVWKLEHRKVVSLSMVNGRNECIEQSWIP